VIGAIPTSSAYAFDILNCQSTTRFGRRYDLSVLVWKVKTVGLQTVPEENVRISFPISLFLFPKCFFIWPLKAKRLSHVR
jgi:hypothetical protein